MDGIVEMAKLFKDRDNKEIMGIEIGTVINITNTDIQISLGDKIILTKNNLIFSEHVLKGYKRHCEIYGNINFQDISCGNTNTVDTHLHTINDLNIDTESTMKGTIKYIDTLKVNDKVIMITQDRQKYYVLDRMVVL